MIEREAAGVALAQHGGQRRQHDGEIAPQRPWRIDDQEPGAGERAVAAAVAKFGTMFGASSLGTVSLEELRKAHDTPQMYQFY